MKKNIKAIICAALCLIMCVGMLTSCAGSPFDANKYDKDIDKFMLKLLDAECNASIVSEEFVNDAEDLFGIDGVKTYIIAENNLDKVGHFIFFDSKAEAKTSKRALDDWTERYEDSLAGHNLVVKRSGNLVFMGDRSIWRASGEMSVDVALSLIVVGVVAFIFAAVILIICISIIAAVILIVIAIFIIIIAAIASAGKKRKRKKLEIKRALEYKAQLLNAQKQKTQEKAALAEQATEQNIPNEEASI